MQEKQTMRPFEFIKSTGVKITWEIIREGWQGPADLIRIITIEDVHDMADREILKANEEELEVLSELSLSKNELDIGELLSHLAPAISSKAKRIWIAALLHSKLANLGTEYFHGLIELTDFWLQFDFPEDSPHIVQGRGNNISPQDYYTAENFHKILELHKQWLQSEIDQLAK